MTSQLHDPAGGPTAARYRSPRTPLVYRPRPPIEVPPPARRAPAVATLLTPDERLRVQAALLDAFVAVHHEALDDLARALRLHPCAAVVVSTARLAAAGRAAVPRLAELVRAFPRTPLVALLGDPDPGAPQLLLALGRVGVRCLVDARHADGWAALRTLLGDDPLRQVARDAIARLEPAVAGAGEGCARFFRAVFDPAPEAVTVRTLARRLGVAPTTLMSRFARAGLPSPKRYLAFARLVRAARLLENRGATLSSVADRLDYSSAQSFGRHVRLLLDVSAAEFRRDYDADAMLARFGRELVEPYADRLRTFRPFGRG
ncbi:helix-turn-helix domain-containing protein [Roseisolibacter sp. H3M3-2]|uniref:helix-turn-helix transcriptional regulator n=1 Tax=Roseisolibacter sp. H3M3-2 TaxID=3031323 RepID=UPI0023DC1F03|nr:helix-turn-helix domain-containing protein [Roseisolibacter sp. H3M3-2]MDF1503214.1 helix-turn-helix domain-containing protein [Roseisolibacter sp. H3M3-2]